MKETYNTTPWRKSVMRILIAEDDFISRKFMVRFLSQYGACDVAVDGREAIEAFKLAVMTGEHYDLICMDIMMPVVDGYQALKEIREIEKFYNFPQEKMTKIIMTTALSEGKNVTKAFEFGCTAYAGKPIDIKKFENVLRKLDLIGSK